jgi:hypothetical protein
MLDITYGPEGRPAGLGSPLMLFLMTFTLFAFLPSECQWCLMDLGYRDSASLPFWKTLVA